MKMTAAQLAQLIGATVEGDPDVSISAPAKIEEAEAGSVTFLGNPAYEHYLYTTRASAVLVANDFQPRQTVAPTLLRVADVYLTVSQLLGHFQARATSAIAKEVSPHAIVDESATLAEDVGVGKLSIVEAGATIGSGSIIHDQVYVGRDVRVGRDCVIYPGVRLLRGCVIGDRCTIHANVVIGGDGFGFAPDTSTGRYSKIPQVGNVIIEPDVEIGAGTTIDRASLGSTIIRRGVKLDNLIQVAHNVEIGENTVIAAQTGIAGSAKIGKNCRIGGQVGIAGHKVIADGSQFQAQTGVTNHIKRPNGEYAGSPYMPWKLFMRSAALFKMLPEVVQEFRDRLRALEDAAGQPGKPKK